MIFKPGPLIVTFICTLLISCGGSEEKNITTVPMTLDHNRMLVNAEIQRKDGTWRNVRLWVDTGSPGFWISPALARDLGVDLSWIEHSAMASFDRELPSPPSDSIRIGNLELDFNGVVSRVMFEPDWLFMTMHCDGNLPSTVLQKYRVVFDYPRKELSLALPGTHAPRGSKVLASIDTSSGIIQIDATIDGQPLSFALGNGASYSFVSADIVNKLAADHPQWPVSTGAVGCANIWGWWPGESTRPIIRIPEIDWGGVKLEQVALAGLPDFFGGHSIGAWYSKKTARPVDGFLGPNAFKSFRVEIDYPNNALYFEKGAELDTHDLDIVGLTLQPQSDSSYVIIGVAEKNGVSAAPAVQPEDVLLRIDSLECHGATMGTVEDALRGTPGETRTLVLERDGEQVTVKAEVQRFP